MREMSLFSLVTQVCPLLLLTLAQSQPHPPRLLPPFWLHSIFYFLDYSVFYFLISKECWHGSSFHGNTFQTASVSMMCSCISSSDCMSARDTEVCSILWTCILTSVEQLVLGKRLECDCFFVSLCLFWCVWLLAKVIRAEVYESYLRSWMSTFLKTQPVQRMEGEPLFTIYFYINTCESTFDHCRDKKC